MWFEVTWTPRGLDGGEEHRSRLIIECEDLTVEVWEADEAEEEKGLKGGG